MDVKVDSQLIRTERENRGWSQSHLADVAGLSLRTIQRIEKTGSASFESVTALAAIFSIDVAVLRGAEPEPEPEPKRLRAIRLSLELPVRLVLAVVSGVLCALHFESNYWGSSSIGFQWFDYGIAGGLFAVTVLCPYLKPGNGLILRSLALIGASALSYFCAILILEADSLPFDSELFALLLASTVGVSVVLVAARYLTPLQVTARYWALGLAASLAGGAVMYVSLEMFDFSLVSMTLSYSAWHALACVAIYYGHRPSDAENGMLTALARKRGRFSIVPGWMRLEHSRAAGLRWLLSGGLTTAPKLR